MQSLPQHLAYTVIVNNTFLDVVFNVDRAVQLVQRALGDLECLATLLEEVQDGALFACLVLKPWRVDTFRIRLRLEA